MPSVKAAGETICWDKSELPLLMVYNEIIRQYSPKVNDFMSRPRIELILGSDPYSENRTLGIYDHRQKSKICMS